MRREKTSNNASSSGLKYLVVCH